MKGGLETNSPKKGAVCLFLCFSQGLQQRLAIVSGKVAMQDQ
jgi:hypothetical protein